jgi:hypothetical protein
MGIRLRKHWIVSHQFTLPDVPTDRTLAIQSPADNSKHVISLWKTPLRKTRPEQD